MNKHETDTSLAQYQRFATNTMMGASCHTFRCPEMNKLLQYSERGKPHSLSLFSCGSSIVVELEFGHVVLVFVEGRKPVKNPPR